MSKSFFEDHPNFYWDPATMSGIDFADKNGIASVTKENGEQLRLRYPNAQYGTWEEFEALQAAHDKNRFSTVVEIDEGRYDEMLNVLPPNNWVQQGRVAMFQLCELTTGNWTSTYLKWGDRYFETTCIVRTKLPELVEKVKQTFTLEALH